MSMRKSLRDNFRRKSIGIFMLHLGIVCAGSVCFSNAITKGRCCKSGLVQKLDHTTERLKELNNLLEDVAKTAVSTGPRVVVRLAQGIEAVVTVGGEYLFQLLTVTLLATRVLIGM